MVELLPPYSYQKRSAHGGRMRTWKALLLIAGIVLTYANFIIFGTLSSTTRISQWSDIHSE